MKKVLIFDCFGVISTQVDPYWAKRFFSEDEYKIISKEIIEKGDIGEFTIDQVYENLSLLSNEPKEQIKRDWESYAHFREDLLEEIKKLKNKFKIVLLSNAAGDFVREIFKRINPDEYFDEIIISSDICLVKPNRDIFEYALDKIGATSLECVFIDDNEKNIEGAKKAHIDGILFKNTEQFKEDLTKMLENQNIY